MAVADGGEAHSTIRIQLDSLEQYARELEGQLMAVERVAGGFGACPAWGNFGQAYGLTIRHQQSLKEMWALLTKVRDGIAFSHAAAAGMALEFRTVDDLSRARLDQVTRAFEESADAPAARPPLPGSAG